MRSTTLFYASFLAVLPKVSPKVKLSKIDRTATAETPSPRSRNKHALVGEIGSICSRYFWAVIAVVAGVVGLYLVASLVRQSRFYFATRFTTFVELCRQYC